MDDFARWFVQERVRRGFSTQILFSDAATVGRSTVQSIENGEGFARRRPDQKERIARTLGRTVAELEQLERDMAEGRQSPLIAGDGGNYEALLDPRTQRAFQDTAATFGHSVSLAAALTVFFAASKEQRNESLVQSLAEMRRRNGAATQMRAAAMTPPGMKRPPKAKA